MFLAFINFRIVEGKKMFEKNYSTTFFKKKYLAGFYVVVESKIINYFIQDSSLF
jgi:hypothetical protein